MPDQVWFVVERIDLAQPALKKNLDNPLGSRAMVS
jgi:hypothetical protein